MTKCRCCGSWIGWIRPQKGRPVPVEPRPVVVMRATMMPDCGTEDFITGEGEWIKGRRTPAGPVGGNLVVYEPHRKYCNSKRCRGRRL